MTSETQNATPHSGRVLATENSQSSCSGVSANIPAYREATCKLCDLHVRSREYETAWQDYEDFLNAGGERIPPDVWLDLCRVPEQQQEFERAVSEYERLAAAYPSERQSVMAQLGAARICLKRLNRPQDALRLYEV